MLSAGVLGVILTFTLPAIPLDDGGTLSGSFVWDSVRDQVTTWDLTATTGHSFDGLEYTPSNSTLGQGDHIRLDLRSGLRALTLAFGHSRLERGLYRGNDAFIDPFDQDTFERQALLDAAGNFLTWFPYRAPIATSAYPFASIDVSGVPEPTTLLWLSLALFAAFPVKRLRSAAHTHEQARSAAAPRSRRLPIAQ
jgi:hypothetical protein